jgi:SAM-dependent methyltransferase
MSPKFLALLTSEDLKGVAALDVGCGTGRLTLALAPLCPRVIGIDWDARTIREARERATALGLENVEFVVADAEAEEYTRWAPQLVAAHLCMSPAIIARAGRVLGPGEMLAFVCFHVDQWKETGKVSRFAFDEREMRKLLEDYGFRVEHLEVEREVREFGSTDDALAHAEGLRAKWESDGRWQRYTEFLERGGRTLTRSHLIVKAGRR